MSYFCLNIKDDILENVSNQTVAGPQCEKNNNKSY